MAKSLGGAIGAGMQARDMVRSLARSACLLRPQLRASRSRGRTVGHDLARDGKGNGGPPAPTVRSLSPLHGAHRWRVPWMLNPRRLPSMARPVQILRGAATPISRRPGRALLMWVKATRSSRFFEPARAAGRPPGPGAARVGVGDYAATRGRAASRICLSVSYFTRATARSSGTQSWRSKIDSNRTVRSGVRARKYTVVFWTFRRLRGE